MKLLIEKPADIGKAHNALSQITQSVFDGKKWEIGIKPYRKPRSLNANAYLWRLCDDIAKAISITKEDVYRTAVREVGVFQIVPIRDDAVDRWMHVWSDKGLGWFSEKMDGCRLEGYSKTINYYGSSVYNTAEMSRLVDYIVQQANEIGLETKTPDELARLKSLWGDQMEKKEGV